MRLQELFHSPMRHFFAFSFQQILATSLVLSTRRLLDA
jgi:hypothetical protein